jgi:hypothetical protein
MSGLTSLNFPAAAVPAADFFAPGGSAASARVVAARVAVTSQALAFHFVRRIIHLPSADNASKQ